MTAFGAIHLVMAALSALLGLGHLALWSVVRERVQLAISVVFLSFAVSDFCFGANSVGSGLHFGPPTLMLFVSMVAFAGTAAGLPMIAWLALKRPLNRPRVAYFVFCMAVAGGRLAAAVVDDANGAALDLDTVWLQSHFSWALPSALMVISVPLEWAVEAALAVRRKDADRFLLWLVISGAVFGLPATLHGLLVVLGRVQPPVVYGLSGVVFLFVVSGYLGRTYIRATRRASGIGGYEIVQPLGRGGMGETFVAVRKGVEGFARQVVLKKMRVGSDPTDRARFLSEAKLAAALRHPNIVDVLDLGELDGGDLFIAMELINGATVSELCRAANTQELRLPPSVVAAIGVQLCKGLAHAHRAGVLHRDIKRANVMVSVDGVVKLIDFGLAQQRTQAKELPIADLEKLASGLTRHSTVIGTPGYLSAERLRGDPAAAASDLFAVGVLLYELLAGNRPFEGLDGNEDVQALLEGRHRPLGEVRLDVPAPLVAVIERCLSVEARQRPADAASLGRELAASVDVGQVDLAEWVAKLSPAATAPSAEAQAMKPDSTQQRAEAKTTPFKR